MFTAFMVALTLTTVANVLVTMALAPLFTALLSRAAAAATRCRRAPGAPSSWPGLGIAWMYGQQVSAGDARQLLGTAVALGVPIAAAINWTLLHHHRDDAKRRHAAGAC